MDFDYTQLEAASNEIAKLGISDKRKRNEAIRKSLGNYYDVGDATLSSSGYQLASNQNVDPQLFDIFGDYLQKDSQGKVYYRGNDYSTAQLGTSGYNTSDTGLGTYDITKDGNTIGKSYGSVQDAIQKYMDKYYKENYEQDLTKWNKIWQDENDDKTHGADIVRNAVGRLQDMGFDPYNAPSQEQYDYITPTYKGSTSGILGDWEALGQLINAQNNPTYTYGQTSEYPDQGSTAEYIQRYLLGSSGQTGNNIPENISGLDTLYGSTPVLWNNSVLGYLMDLGPNESSQFGYTNPLVNQMIDKSGSTRSNYTYWRDLGDLSKWADLGKFTDNSGNYFAPTSNIENLPGWQQGDIKQYSHKSNSMASNVIKAIGTVLQFTPLAGLGYLMSMMSSAYQGNPIGALASFAGGSGLTGTLSGKLQGITGLSKAASNAITSGTLGGALSQLGGGNFATGALTSALGSMTSAQLKDLFGSDAAAALGGTLTKSGLQQLFGKSNISNVNQFTNNIPLYQRQQAEEEKKKQTTNKES